MKKYLIPLLTCGILIGCGSNNVEVENTEESTEEEEVAALADEPPELEEDNPEIEEDNTEVSETTLSQSEIDSLKIPTTPIESPYGEDGDLTYEHTEKEIVQEYMDENGRIYFALDDQPIRSIVYGKEGNISNVSNYGDAFIDMMASEAFNLPDPAQIEEVYQLFLTNPAEELEGLGAADYRTWEEATNLERGIMQMVYLIAPPLNDIGFITQGDLYEHEALQYLLAEFERIGSPSVLIPQPQTPLDYQLFDNMQMVKAMWGSLGQFEDPKNNKEEFEEFYGQVRQETNNLLARVNYTLSEEW